MSALMHRLGSHCPIDNGDGTLGWRTLHQTRDRKQYTTPLRLKALPR